MKAKEILEQLNLDNYEEIFHSLGVEEIRKNDAYWILPTLCHNLDIENASYKLYFYLNTRTTFCFTECQKSRDIIDLIADRWTLEGKEYKFGDILNYICDICGIRKSKTSSTNTLNPLAWKKRLSVYQPTQNIHYWGKRYDKDILGILSDYHHPTFLNDGISDEVMDRFNIGYYPVKNQITIPVYDVDGSLIGIHCRNLNPSELEKGRKYIPLKTISGLDYRFKSHEVLYGLNLNEEYIKHTKQIQLFESPKAVLQLSSMYPQTNSVGMFGLNLGKQRRDTIIRLGVSEVIIGVDKDYESINDLNPNSEDNYTMYLHNVNRIANLFKGYCKVSVLYDGTNLLGYKDSPTDKGKDVYEYLYEHRVGVEA